MIGASLIGAGAARFVHALGPGVFTRNASRTIERLHGHKARGRVSQGWLGCEI